MTVTLDRSDGSWHASPSLAPYSDLPSDIPTTTAMGSTPVDAAMAALDALHSSTHLPWWALIPLATVGLRTALLPIAVYQIKATSSLQPLIAAAQSSASKEVRSYTSSSRV